MKQVAVVMPIYNCENYSELQDSVQSVINQTFKDWNLYICNDGSQDNGRTASYLKKIQTLDSRIKIIEYSQNMGAGYARNKILTLVKEKYVIFQDSDDISIKTRFQKLVNFIENHSEYSFVGSAAAVFDDEGIWGKYEVKRQPKKKDFLWNMPFAHPTLLIKTKILKKMGGYRIAPETKRAEDYDLLFRLYGAGYKGYNLQEKLYMYKIINDPQKKYRSMKDRWGEAVVRYKGYKLLKMRLQGIPYIVKPLIIGLIPQRLFYKIRNKNYRTKNG